MRIRNFYVGDIVEIVANGHPFKGYLGTIYAIDGAYHYVRVLVKIGAADKQFSEGELYHHEIALKHRF